MAFGVARRVALLVVVVMGSGAALFSTAKADEGQSGGYTSFDISWPQCPNNLPDHRFEFAIIGINGGRPFTSNPCFTTQYRWAQAAQSNPDVYINVDFPRQGLAEAMEGPYGKCAETDDWCRGYNWGYNLARNSIARARVYNITPGRYWLDVETDNYWSASARNNSQVIRGALDYFLDFNVPIGIYSTYYQWGLITGNYMPKQAKLPIWVAGATSPEMAAERCNDPRFSFAGGETWLVQYVRQYDQNHACKAMWDSLLSNARQKNQPIFAKDYEPPAPAAAQPTVAPTATPEAQPATPVAPPAAQAKDAAPVPAAVAAGFSPVANVLNALKGSLFTSK